MWIPDKALLMPCRGVVMADTSDRTTKRLAEMLWEADSMAANLSVPTVETDLRLI